MDAFDDFIGKEKFLADSDLFYAGLSETEETRLFLVENINQLAENYRILSQKTGISSKDYLQKMKETLDKVKEVFMGLDTEDRERFLMYIEEIMDLVGLESSEGLLNTFMYGFDPMEIDPLKRNFTSVKLSD
jgi:Domain of unknown function (DUF4844)